MNADGSLFHLFAPILVSATRRSALYFNVKAFNNNELHSILSSRPIFLKTEANALASWVYDGMSDLFDIDYQTYTSEISGYFQVGTNCPLQGAHWLVETADGMLVHNVTGVNTAEFIGNMLDNHYFVSSDQVSLYNDETYRIVVRATDHTGEVHILQSNGSAVSTLSVQPGQVLDGSVPEQDLNYQRETSILHAQWSGFGDGSPEQEITHYDVAVGSDVGYPNTRSDIVPFTSVGLNTSVTWENLDLVPQSIVYYSTVRAYTVSGAFIDVTSNGIRVGYGQSIIPGIITTPQYQSETTTFTAYWTDFESDLPIRSYEWALLSQYLNANELESLCEDVSEIGEGSGSHSASGQDFKELGFQLVDQDTSAFASNLNLEHNTTYYIAVRAIDSGAKCTVAISNGTLIDITPPVPSRLLSVGSSESNNDASDWSDYVIYVQPATDLAVSWETFTDGETGTVQYDVGIFEQHTCGEDVTDNRNITALVDFRNVGTALATTFEGILLKVGVSYTVVIKGTNAVGLSSSTQSQPIVLDSGRVVPGRVKDGTVWNSDVVFQSDLTTLSAVFTHATSHRSGRLQSGPCPESAFHHLTNFDPAWNVLAPRPGDVIGNINSAAVSYNSSQVTRSLDPAGIRITAHRNIRLADDLIITGAYQTFTQVSDGDSISFDIRAAIGNLDLQEHAVTSVIFIDSGQRSDILADYDIEQTSNFVNYPPFSAFGVQIHHGVQNELAGNFTSPKVVMWAKDSTMISAPNTVTRDVTIDLSQVHRYTIKFILQQLSLKDRRKAELYIDGTIAMILEGLPNFSNSTRMVFHVFNRLGYVPTIEDSLVSPAVEAILANISLPSRGSHLCDYGMPFYSEESPIIKFMAGVGTTIASTDIKALKVSLDEPCILT